MRDKKKRDRDAAEVDNRSELKYFAQRNKVSMDEARTLMGQFGDRRPTGTGDFQKARPAAKPRAPHAKSVKGHSLGDAAMNEREEEFMDKWLDRNITSSQLKHSEPLVAKVLAKRCIADAEKEGVAVKALEEVVVDVEQAISDELKVAKAKEARMTKLGSSD
jgi:hypothetical protein